MSRRKAEIFLAQGRALLEQSYGAQIPSGLRLDLPFGPKATRREAPQEDPLEDAEKAFYQTLAVKEGMREARLGLAYVYLSQGKYSAARQQFQAVLDGRGDDYQALLGRGSCSFEEAIAREGSPNRKSHLELALSDFENVLRKRPDSVEALYNKIQTLYQLGRHNEAVQRIQEYLSRDRHSIWPKGSEGFKPNSSLGSLYDTPSPGIRYPLLANRDPALVLGRQNFGWPKLASLRSHS